MAVRVQVSPLPPTSTKLHNIMLEYYLVIKNEHHPDKFIPVNNHWNSRYVWWGPGAEAKANRACKKLNRTLPAFHYCIVDSVMTA